MKKRRYVVRVAMDEKEIEKVGATSLLECLRYAGLVVVHNERIFDIKRPGPPSLEEDVWAEQNAARMRSFGWNAVKAPAWGDPERSQP